MTSTVSTMFLLLFTVIVDLLLVVKSAELQPIWQIQLNHYNLWKGSINYEGKETPCMLQVRHVDRDPAMGVQVTFTADNIQLDMIGRSDDGINVVFTEDTRWKGVDHFMDQTNMRFTGKFKMADVNYYYEGNVSSDDNPSFGTVWVIPSGQPVEIVHENTSLRYGLAIGIPVTLAVVLTVTAAFIMWWACKKGYLRHVPMTYKHFTNPKPKKSSGVMKLDTEYGKGEAPSVHI